MARRTRRPKVVWLPNSNTERLGVSGVATSGIQSGFFETAVVVGPGAVRGLMFHSIIPVVKDDDQVLTGPVTLADIESSGYRLRRIVGKIFVECDQDANQSITGETRNIAVTCGFIVLKVVRETGAPINANQTDYSPATLDGIGDPWIWQRTWCVGRQKPADAPGIDGFSQFPQNNVFQYGGGVLDGPHIDAKTARVISAEERLFLVVTATALDGDAGSVAEPPVIIVTGHLRCLASMRTNSGNRRNASR